MPPSGGEYSPLGNQDLVYLSMKRDTLRVRKHKKVTAKCCQVAADIVNARIAAGTSFVPESLALRKVVGVTIKKQRKKESKANKAAKAVKKAAAATVG